ncbi:hypothetical protein AVEN_20644-1 [Araneus ventricosus]|uniref:DUF5641 domain-containing protein n=1 Tax=Araneus ventricosus TaxID=182803 RepID=A0A4Y2IW39_ARAVE|nr:hypothetical protein AVEN_20644-1 [Araneus ventricosus]
MSTSKLIQLHEFLDRKWLLRVGGRLRDSNLPDSVKYPIILPKEYPITSMLVKLYHLNYPHSEVQAVNSAIRCRGKPIELFSDFGTNFVGARHVLKLSCSETIGRYLANDEVIWRINVPFAPRFGDLLEIEAVLNSRSLVAALVAASDDPDDLSVITPGHFLVGEEIQRIPEPDLSDQEMSIRERLKITLISQSFWRSWSKDYLTQLQVRTKWKRPCDGLKVNDLVLIKDDNLLPVKWIMTRVLDVYQEPTNI